MVVKRFIFYIFLFVHSVICGQGVSDSLVKKTISNLKIRFLEFGIGVPNSYFRDKTSSSLAYQGTGLVAFHFSSSKENLNKHYREWNFNARLQNAKPDIQNVTEWNKPATIYAMDFMFRKLKDLKLKNESKWHLFAGGSIGSNLQVALIPSANNTFAYNLSWLQLGLEGMVTRVFKIGNNSIQFINQTSLPFFGLNVRPLSFVGLPPQDVIWSQNSEISSSFFKNPKLFSMHNNFVVKNELGVSLLFKKSKLGVNYSWQYQSNTVSVNSLNSIASSVSIYYAFKLSNKSK